MISSVPHCMQYCTQPRLSAAGWSNTGSAAQAALGQCPAGYTTCLQPFQHATPNAAVRNSRPCRPSWKFPSPLPC